MHECNEQFHGLTMNKVLYFLQCCFAYPAPTLSPTFA